MWKINFTLKFILKFTGLNKEIINPILYLKLLENLKVTSVFLDVFSFRSSVSNKMSFVHGNRWAPSLVPSPDAEIQALA